MIDLNEVYPEVVAPVRCRNNKLSAVDRAVVDSILIDIENGNDDWKDYIKRLAPLMLPYNSTNGQSAPSLPLELIQIIYLINHKFKDAGQQDILKEFKHYGVIKYKKFFNRDITVSDYTSYKTFKLPNEYHINYQGQKHGVLAEGIKHLVYQAGAYDCLVDIFGGSGAASIAIPRKNNSVYVYNDLDTALCCLYDTVADDTAYNLLIDYLIYLQEDLADRHSHTTYRLDGKKLKKKVEDRDTAVHPLVHLKNIDFDAEIRSFYNSKQRLDEKLQFLYNQTNSDISSGNIFENVVALLGALIQRKDDIECAEFMEKYFPDAEAHIKNNELYKDVLTIAANMDVISEFCKSHNILMSDITYSYIDVESGKNTTDNIDYESYKDRALQYRFFMWWVYFNNVLENNSFVKTAWQTNSDDKIIVAMAEIFRWSFLTNGTPGASSVYRMLLTVDEIYSNKTQSKDWLSFIEKDFYSIITDIHNRVAKRTKVVGECKRQNRTQQIESKSIVENLPYDAVIDMYKVGGVATISHKKTLFYSDYPYQESSDYVVGAWSATDSQNLIDSLLTSGGKFIFSCRASLKKNKMPIGEALEKTKKGNQRVYQDVFKYFEQRGSSLYVMYINLDGRDFVTALKDCKTTEIMITNYPIQMLPSAMSADTFEIMTYKQFMKTLNNNLIM